MDTRAMIAALALLAASPVRAEAPVYRWTDAQGQVHYGDRPGASVAERLNPPPPPLPPPPPPPPLPAPPPPAIPRADGWFCRSLRGEVSIFERRAIYLIAQRRTPERDRLLAENRASYERAARDVTENNCGK